MRAWTEVNTAKWRVSIHAPKDSLTIRVPCLPQGGFLLLALCPLADSRRQRQRRTALESGTW